MAPKKASVKREFKPRKPVVLSPILVSQLTCESMLGINPQRYLEAVNNDPELPRKRLGKLVLTDPADWARRLAPAVPSPPDRVDGDEETGDGVDDVLSAIGFRRTA